MIFVILAGRGEAVEHKHIEVLERIESDYIRKVEHCEMMLEAGRNQKMYRWQRDVEKEKLDALQWVLSELKTKL